MITGIKVKCGGCNKEHVISGDCSYKPRYACPNCSNVQSWEVLGFVMCGGKAAGAVSLPDVGEIRQEFVRLYDAQSIRLEELAAGMQGFREAIKKRVEKLEELALTTSILVPRGEYSTLEQADRSTPEYCKWHCAKCGEPKVLTGTDSKCPMCGSGAIRSGPPPIGHGTHPAVVIENRRRILALEKVVGPHSGRDGWSEVDRVLEGMIVSAKDASDQLEARTIHHRGRIDDHERRLNICEREFRGQDQMIDQDRERMQQIEERINALDGKGSLEVEMRARLEDDTPSIEPTGYVVCGAKRVIRIHCTTKAEAEVEANKYTDAEIFPYGPAIQEPKPIGYIIRGLAMPHLVGPALFDSILPAKSHLEEQTFPGNFTIHPVLEAVQS